jgi:hypothetical protein
MEQVKVLFIENKYILESLHEKKLILISSACTFFLRIKGPIR